MSLALYRKYRPATFAELKGQEHVAEPLQRALRNGRIHHAYLFSGPRGCGKTSSARILARSLNCEQGPTPEPCGKCDSCVALGPTGSGHIDVIEIDAASHGGVDDARDLRERAFFAPVSARFKIYIIDEAHMVTREGFNALLKLVEEPPPHLKFVFATTEPEKVIGTIRSRTHHYPFRLIPPGTLRELLDEILDKEGVRYEPAALPLVVRAGAGSARDSESILDQLLAGAGEDGITYARAVSLLGYTDTSLLDEVVDAFAAHDGAAVFAAVDRVIEGGQDPRRFAADLLERFRDLIVLSNVPDAGTSGLLDVPPDELEQMQSQVSRLGAAELARAADLLHTGLTEMRGATSPRLLLELICARILLPGAYEDGSSLLARLERLERRLAIDGAETEGALPAGAASAQPPRETAAAKQQSPTGRRPAPAPDEDQRPGRSADRPGRQLSPPAERDSRQPHSAVPTGEQPPPAQGGDPDSIVSRGAGGTKDERRSVDNPADAEDSASPAGRRPVQPPPAPAPASQPAAAPGGIDITAVRRHWGDILEAIKRRSKVAWMVLMDGVQPVSLDGNRLTLAFANEGKRKGFTVGGKDAVLGEALNEILGVDWRIDAVLDGSSAGGGRPAPNSGRPVPAPSGPAGNSGRSASARPPAPSRQPEPSAPPRDRDEVPLPPAPADEADEVDPEGDADAGADAELSGMELVQRELGGKIINEIDNS